MLYGLVSRLQYADPELIVLAEAVGADSDVFIAQVDRTVAEEQADIDAGRSWLTDPMDSNHVVDPVRRPLAEALDLAPYDVATHSVPWTDIPRFQALGATVKAEAAKRLIALAWGGDWTHRKDWDHFELVAKHGGQA